MATVAVLHAGLPSHVGPTSRLGALLAEQGHRVLAWAPEEFRDQVATAGVEFHADDQCELFDAAAPQLLAAALAERTELETGDWVERLLEHEVDLVVHDCHALWGRVASELLGLPRIVLFPYLPRGAAMLPPALPVEPALAAASDQLAQLKAGVERAELARWRSKQRWAVDLGYWRDVLFSPSATRLVFTVEWLTGHEEPSSEWIFAGPLMAPSTWSDGDRGARPRGRVDVCLISDWRFLPDLRPIVVSASGGGAGFELQGVPGRQPVASEQLLGAGALVTHGDIETVHAGLRAGVPLVCLPQTSDQHGWASRAVELGCGVLAEPSVEGVRSAVEQVLGDEDMRRHARALGRRLARFDGANRVAIAVRDVIDRWHPAARS
jgi:UDP:flavonoid glycosyltransferase YjiC (YdhE family)